MRPHPFIASIGTALLVGALFSCSGDKPEDAPPPSAESSGDSASQKAVPNAEKEVADATGGEKDPGLALAEKIIGNNDALYEAVRVILGSGQSPKAQLKAVIKANRKYEKRFVALGKKVIDLQSKRSCTTTVNNTITTMPLARTIWLDDAIAMHRGKNHELAEQLALVHALWQAYSFVTLKKFDPERAKALGIK